MNLLLYISLLRGITSPLRCESEIRDRIYPVKWDSYGPQNSHRNAESGRTDMHFDDREVPGGSLGFVRKDTSLP